MDFSVSVIIPAYNVEKFIKKTVDSVVYQPFLSEVLVVNDGSSDNTQRILENLKKEHSIIKILQHKNGVNKGRSASRNLGIKNASSNFIAFLDADDFFLENRFINDKKIFLKNKQADGVYNAVGFHFYRKQSEQEKENFNLTTITKIVSPEDLFETLLCGKYGHFHINGLTIKKSIFEKVGYFNKNLMVTEDTDLFWKMALKCNLIPGILNKEVAIRGIHDENVFNKKEVYENYILKLYESMYIWGSCNHVGLKTLESFLDRIWILQFKKQLKLHNYIQYWVHLNLKAPKILFSHLGIKYFPLVSMRKKLFPLLYKRKIKL